MSAADIPALPVERARRLVDEAKRIAVLTGAGISTDSGIPDFRGPNGLWTKNPAAEKAATLQHYMGDKEVRIAAWQNRLESPMWDAEPNSGHAAIVELQRRNKLLGVITQNVDGLHQKAGTDPEKVIEVHGTVNEVMCMSCDERAPMARALARVRAGEDDPACRTCGGILKSATISFGQQLVPRDLLRAEEVAQTCDLMLAVGSTLMVFPAAEVVPIAKSAGAPVVIINADETGFDHIADVLIRAHIGEVLPRICGAD
ncbi:MAG: NAD-dependent deacetylase [Acidimicrobiia bacterium]|jgi:NAD-dependent deacetylase|nr:NAD-dependent deacetylase [Acidimicrobiia bacterium]